MDRAARLPRLRFRLLTAAGLSRRLAWLPYFLYAALAIVAAGLLIYDLNYGPWVYSDSSAYIAAARSLASRQGFGWVGPDGTFLPLTHYPPFYPLVMAVFSLPGIDPLTTTQLINVAGFSLVVLLAGAGTYHLTGSAGWGLCAALALPFSRSLIANFDGAMSEPIFIALTLLSLYLLTGFISYKRGWLWLLSSAIMALAALTRYAGLAGAAAGMLFLLLFGRGRWLWRIGRALFYGLIASLPLLSWIIVQALMEGGVANRSLQFRLDAVPGFFRSLLWVEAYWLPLQGLVPFSRVRLVFALLPLVAILALFFLARKSLRIADRRFAFVALLAIYAAAYTAFLLVSVVFTSPTPDVNERTLAPLLPIFVLIMFGALFMYGRRASKNSIWMVVPLVLAASLAITYWPDTATRLSERHSSGSGYTSAAWRNSDLVQQVKDIPTGIPLISNESSAVLFWNRRHPYELSAVFWLPEGELHPPAELRPDFANQCLALVMFDTNLTQPYGEMENAVLRRANQEWDQPLPAWDGALFFSPACR